MEQDQERKQDEQPDEEVPFEDKGTDIVYSPVPAELGNEGRDPSRPPGAPVTPTPRAEHERSKKGEECIAREQGEE